MLLYRHEPIKVGYYNAKFGSHRRSGKKDIVVLLQDHEIEGSYDFIDRSPSRQVMILPSLVTISTVVVEI